MIVYKFIHIFSEESELMKPEENQNAEVWISASFTNESRLVYSVLLYVCDFQTRYVLK